MLTGRETIAVAFAETAHRHRARPALHHADGPSWTAVRWGALVARVRLLALGLAEEGVGPGGRVSTAGLSVPDRWALGLAATSVGAVVDDGATTRTEEQLQELHTNGAKGDEAAPDRFERLRAAVECDDDAFTEGGTTFTVANLLWGAASLATALGAGLDDRLVATLPLDTATGWVAGVLVPVVTGAAAWSPKADVAATAPAARPTIVVCTDADAAALADARPGAPATNGRAPWRRRPTVRPAGLENCRAVLVVDGAAGARRLAERGVPTVGALAVEGHAGLVTGAGGRPLPGVTVGIADDGEVLVRSDAVAPSRCERGWLHTGRRGAVDRGGHLTLAAG